MTGNLAIGGGNSCRVWALNTGETAPASTTPTIIFDRITQTGFTGHPAKQSVTISLTQFKFDSELETFLTTYLTPSTEDDAKSLTYENAETENYSGGSDNAKRLLVQWIGGKSSTKRFVYTGIMKLTGTTGDFTTSGGEAIARGLELVAVPALASCTVAATLFDTTLVTTTGDKTTALAPSSFGEIKFMDSAN